MGLDILLFLLLPVVISVPIAWLLASAQCGESDRAFRAKMRARRIAELEAAVRPWEVWDYEAEYARQHAAQVAEAERLREIIAALQPGMLFVAGREREVRK